MLNGSKKMALFFLFFFFTLSCLMIHPPGSKAAEPVGKFTSVGGTVDVLRGGALPATPVKVGDSVFVKDVIRTKSNSKAEILFVDGNKLILSQRSRIDISEYVSDETKSRAIIKLPRGEVEAKVEKKTINRISISPEANRFEIQTPCAVAGARGSRYKVSQGDNCAFVYVYEGVIYVLNPKFPDKVVIVKAGQVTRVCEDGIPLPAQDATEEEKKGFEKFGMMDAPISSLMDIIIMTSPPGPGTNLQPPITELYPEILRLRETPGCFTSDTKVLMGDKTFKEIVDLKLGDMVQSYNLKTGKVEPQKVTHLFTSDQKHYYLINGKLKVTATHPFFTFEGKWKKVFELKVGDRIQSDEAGKSIEITSIEKKERNQGVYNFKVAANDNYFVSPDGSELYLAHNNNKGCFTPNTKVLMGDQTFKEIVDLKVGDMVQTFEVETGKMVPHKVTRLFTTGQDHYYLINGKLKVTAAHPFLTMEGKWKEAFKLRVGDRIQSDGVGKEVEIISIEKKELYHQVHNFRVADGYNYFVSPDGVERYLVHNIKMCFTPDTQVLMGDYTFKNISNLRLGDIVQSYDFKIGKMVPQKVTHLYSGDEDHYYVINDKLKVTAAHPFLTMEGKWKEAFKLRIGDRVQGSGVGKSIKITSVEKKEVEQEVYNFIVAEGHNYFVSPDGIELYIVHNGKYED